MNEQQPMRSGRVEALVVGLCMLAFTRPSHAYVDPGSVSILITAVLGAIAMVGYTARMYWARFKSALSRMKTKLKRDKPRQEPAEK